MADYDKFKNSKLFKFCEKLADWMILSFLWLICSLPVFTLGASTAALYYSMSKRYSKRATTPSKDFFSAFKVNFKQGTIITLIYLVYGALLAFDIYASRNGIGEFTLPQIYEQVAYVLILPIAFTLPYILPYISRYDNTLKNGFKNAFFLCATHPLHTLTLIVVTLACGAAIFFFPPAALLLPAACAYVAVRIIEPDFIKTEEMVEKAKADAEEKAKAAEEKAAKAQTEAPKVKRSRGYYADLEDDFTSEEEEEL